MDEDVQVLLSDPAEREVVEVFVDEPQLVVVVQDVDPYSVVVLPDPEPQTIQVLLPDEPESQVIQVQVEAGSGLSAYELAVLQGFHGTREQWLASLAGPSGPVGPQGPPGATDPDLPDLTLYFENGLI